MLEGIPDTRRDPVATGLILLFLIASLGAFFLTRARRRFGGQVNGKVWITTIVGFAIVILVIWVASQNR
jgi:hypothetical protein